MAHGNNMVKARLSTSNGIAIYRYTMAGVVRVVIPNTDYADVSMMHSCTASSTAHREV